MKPTLGQRRRYIVDLYKSVGRNRKILREEKYCTWVEAIKICLEWEKEDGYKGRVQGIFFLDNKMSAVIFKEGLITDGTVWQIMMPDRSIQEVRTQ